jgi:hypothetical protein
LKAGAVGAVAAGVIVVGATGKVVHKIGEKAADGITPD